MRDRSALLYTMAALFLSWGLPVGHEVLEPTPNSVRSCVAPAIGRGSPPALAVMKRRFAPTMKTGPEREYTCGAIGVEGRDALVPRARAFA